MDNESRKKVVVVAAGARMMGLRLLSICTEQSSLIRVFDMEVQEAFPSENCGPKKPQNGCGPIKRRGKNKIKRW